MKNRLFKFLSISTFVLFVLSCNPLVDSLSSADKNSDYAVVYGKIENDDTTSGASRLISSQITSGQKFFYEIQATPAQTIIDNYGAEVKKIITTDKTFSFSLIKGYWKFSVKAFLAQNESELASLSPVFVSINDDNSFFIDADTYELNNIKLKIPADGPNGNINISVQLEAASINSARFILKSIPGGTNYTSDCAVSTSTSSHEVKFNKNVAPGHYVLTMEFYSGAISSNQVTGELVYSRREPVTVFPGSSDTYAKVDWNDSELIITDDLIKGNKIHEIYVDGTKTYSNGEKGYGIYSKPFTTLEEASNYIGVVNDGNDSNIDYSIILLSDIGSSETPYSISSSHPLNLTTKSYNSIYSIARSFEIDSSAASVKCTLENIIINSDVKLTNENELHLSGKTYIKNVKSSSEQAKLFIDSPLANVYKDASGTISFESGEGKTKISNLIYEPNFYDESNIKIFGSGLASCYKNIEIKDQSNQKWELLSTGKIQKSIPYISKLTAAPSSDDTVYVKTEEDLIALSSFVNSGIYNGTNFGFPCSFDNVKIEQLATVTLSSEWVPIGLTDTNSFKGIYNGQNFEIKGLKITLEYLEAPTAIGLFGVVKGKVINVKVSGEINDSNESHCGGIVGQLLGGDISNCISDVKIIHKTGWAGARTGGIVGNITSSAVVCNCINKNDVTIGNFNHTAGGIAGYVNSSSIIKIYNCINEGEITSDSSNNNGILGGIVGESNAILNLFNNINKGNVKNTQTSGYAGGILGSASTSYNFAIKNCVNIAQVNAHSNYAIIGEVTSSSGATIQNCYYPNSLGLSAHKEITDVSSQLSDFDNSLKLNTPVIISSSSSQYSTLLDALNAWVAQNGTEYKQWVYKNGELEFGIPEMTSKDSTHTYMSDMSTVPATGSTVYAFDSNDLLKLKEWTASNTLEGVTIVLDKDIDMNGVIWSPMSTSVSYPFKGTISGNNHEIKNIQMSDTGDIAFFEYATSAKISDLCLSGDYTTSGSFNNVYISGFINIADGCEIINCINNVNITNGSSGSGEKIAGFVASMNTNPTKIEKCVNKGSITITAGTKFSAGGIVGDISINNASTIYVRNNVNIAPITYSGTKTSSIYIGGIVGSVSTNSGSCVVIENCGNKGEIKSTASSPSSIHTGGILGCESSGTKSDNKIIACFNAAKVSGGNYCAAILATSSSSATIQYCYWLYNNGCENWKVGEKDEDAANFIKQLQQSTYYVDKPLGESYDSIQAVGPALNQWIESQTNKSDYIKWEYDDPEGKSEPYLPIEK